MCLISYLITILPIPGLMKMLDGSLFEVSLFLCNSCIKSGCEMDRTRFPLGGAEDVSTCSASLKIPSKRPLRVSICPLKITSESRRTPFKERTDFLPSSISLI